MTDNVFVALIKIGRDKFPGALTNNRVARRFLVYCLDNLKAKLRKTECDSQKVRHCLIANH